MSNLEEKFLAYLEGELLEKELEEFESQLREDEELQANLEAFRNTKNLLKDYSEVSFKAQDKLKESILDEIREQPSEAKQTSWPIRIQNCITVKIFDILNPKFARYAIYGLAIIVTGITSMTFLGQEVSETFMTVGSSIDSTADYDNNRLASAPSVAHDQFAAKPKTQISRRSRRKDFAAKKSRRSNRQLDSQALSSQAFELSDSAAAGTMSAPSRENVLRLEEETAEISPEVSEILKKDFSRAKQELFGSIKKSNTLIDSDAVSADSVGTEGKGFAVAAEAKEELSASNRDLNLNSRLVERFVQEREQTKGLKFEHPVGYWRSTYLPGDRAFRSLSMQLKNENYQNLARRMGLPSLILDKQAKPPKRHFDAPEKGALSLYLNTDRKEVSGESRVLLQVGLQGAKRSSSTRPDTTTALVVDTSKALNRNQQKKVIALIEAFLAEKQVGDRFSLYTSEGQLLSPDKFSYGQITVLKPTLFDSRKQITKSVLNDASQYIKGLEGDNDILGSSNIVYITSGKPLPEDTFAARKSAVSGVPISIISLSGPSNELDSFALSGQGNRWFMNSLSDAKRIANSELFAANRVVARAIRINIKLKKGVKLVEVIGSEKLNLQQVAHVKEAEKSIDQRMAKDFSIVADRGEDDDGIQLVIPSFYAGDSHSLLLDLVVPGAGEIADVEMKYKDMVKLKNGSIQAAHSLASGDAERSTMEYSVLSNFLAYELAETLEMAAKLLEQGQAQSAAIAIENRLQLLEELVKLYPQLGEDEALIGDLAMLREYQTVFKRNSGISSNDLQNSLRLAAWKKILSEPETF